MSAGPFIGRSRAAPGGVAGDIGDGLRQEAADQEFPGQAFRHAPRAQVEQRVGVEFPDGRPVRAPHVVRVDGEFGLGVHLRRRRQQQALRGKGGIRALRARRDVDAAVQHGPRARADDAAGGLPADAVGRLVFDADLGVEVRSGGEPVAAMDFDLCAAAADGHVQVVAPQRGALAVLREAVAGRRAEPGGHQLVLDRLRGRLQAQVIEVRAISEHALHDAVRGSGWVLEQRCGRVRFDDDQDALDSAAEFAEVDLGGCVRGGYVDEEAKAHRNVVDGGQGVLRPVRRGVQVLPDQEAGIVVRRVEVHEPRADRARPVPGRGRDTLLRLIPPIRVRVTPRLAARFGEPLFGEGAPAGFPVQPGGALHALCVGTFRQCLSRSHERATRTRSIRVPARAPCPRCARCGRPRARGRSPARCGRAGAGSA